MFEGEVWTVAGTANQAGFKDGPVKQAQFNRPFGVAIDSKGNIVVADYNNNRIRLISPSGDVVTKAGDGNKTEFFGPSGVAFDSRGNIIVIDSGNHRIRLISPTGKVITLSGTGEAGLRDSALTSLFQWPRAVVVDTNGNFIVSEELNHCLRLVLSTGGEVTTIAGTGTAGFKDGLAKQAQFSSPLGVAIDAKGNILVAEFHNHRIRSFSTFTTGEVRNIAGTGQPGFKDGRLDQAQFNNPAGVAVDSKGNIIVADYNNHRIRIIISGTNEVRTLAGVGVDCTCVDGDLSFAQLKFPVGVAVDRDDQIIVGCDDNTIRRIRWTQARG